MFSPVSNQVEKLQFKRLVAVRSIAIAFECITILTTALVFRLELPIIPVVSVIAIYFLFNVFAWIRVNRTDKTLGNKEFFAHLCVDVFALTALLFYTGGSTNPFVSLFLLPLVIVAATLPIRLATAMALLTVICYTLMMFIYIPLPSGPIGHGTEFDVHAFGMWLSFVLGVGIIIFFVLMMAESIRKRDLQLTLAREQSLRDESLVALGTFAAGTAHDLGTPLATMAIVVENLQDDYPEDPSLQQQTTMLNEQIGRCKTILTELSARSGQIRGEGGYVLPLDEYIDKTVSEWRNMRPNTVLKYTGIISDQQPLFPRIIGEQTLRQAVNNLLNNAADACKQQIQLDAKYQQGNLVLEVLDDGAGIASDFTRPSEPLNSSKPQGMGIGMYLTQAVIERLGGKLTLSKRIQGGTCARIDLPLQKLAAESHESGSR